MHNHILTHKGLLARLRFAIILTFLILILEFVGGILTNSLALLSDAGHIFGDIFALCLSWVALLISALPPNHRKTYGYHRAEVLAALGNGLTLFLICGFIFYEAFKRMSSPEEVLSFQMLLIAGVGLGVNLIVASKLKAASQQNLNIKSAFLHVMGDLWASLGVILGGIIMTFTGFYIVDPIISFFVGGIIFRGAYRVSKEALDILLEGVPENVDLDEILFLLKKTDGVTDVHDLHIWTISSAHLALSAHLVVEDQSTHSTGRILSQIKEKLSTKCKITHVTIQFECQCCAGEQPECIVAGGL
jgi:cobalt-zinc-cadmium efflux system protein